MTDVLMVTTTVGMLDGVHGDTSDTGPVVALCLLAVPRVDSLEEGFVASLATGADADHGSAGALDGLPLTGGELDTGDPALVGVTDDDGGGAGRTGETSAVSHLGLDVGDDRTLGHDVDWENVADGEGRFIIIKKKIELTLAAAVNELSGVHSFNGDEVLDSLLVAIGVPEGNLGERRTSAGIVNNVLNHSLDVT